MAAPPLSAFIQAELGLTPTDAGGRSRPISSGYRCNCWLGGLTEEGDRTYNDVVIYFESAEELRPGSSAIVRLQPAFPDLWTDVVAGDVIDVCEGSRVVGKAAVLDLFPSP